MAETGRDDLRRASRPEEDEFFAPSIDVWPYWMLVVFSLVFTFAVPALMISRRIWQANKRRAAVGFGLAGVLLYFDYVYALFSAGLSWWNSLLLQIAVALGAGVAMGILQRLILGQELPLHSRIVPWRRKNPAFTARDWGRNFLSVALIFYAAAVTLTALGWMVARFQNRIYAPLPGWIFFSSLAALVPAVVFTTFFLLRRGPPIPAACLVAFFAGGLLLAALAAGGLGLLEWLIPDEDFLLREAAMNDWRAGRLFSAAGYAVFSGIVLGGAFFLGVSRRIKTFFARATMMLFAVVFAAVNLRFLDSSFAHLYYLWGKRQAQETPAGSALKSIGWLTKYLSVFPETPRKGEIVDLIFRQQLEQGRIEESKATLRRFLDGSGGDRRHAHFLEEAKAKLAGLEKWDGREPKPAAADLPVIGKEDYLDPNWSGLLSLMRFWDRKISDEEFNLKLQRVSLSEERILLPPLTEYAAIAEYARRLGFEVRLLRADGEELKSLLARGVPVLVRHWIGFLPVSGFDARTESFQYYRYERQPGKKLSRQTIEESVYLRGRRAEAEAGDFTRRRKEILAELSGAVFLQDWAQQENILVLVFSAGAADGELARLGYDPAAVRRQTRALTLFSLGELSVAGEDLTGAVKYYLAAREAAPEFAFLERYLGVAYLQLNRIENDPRRRGGFGIDYDRQQFRRWLAEGGDEEELKRMARQVEEMVGKKDPAVGYHIIHRYLLCLREDFPEERRRALPAWEWVVALYPDNAFNRLGLARVCEKEGNRAGQIGQFEYLTGANPRETSYRLRLAQLYAEEGNFPGVRKQLAAVEWPVRKKHADYFYLRGLCRVNEGRLRPAERDFRRALRLNRHRVDFHFQRAKVLRTLRNFRAAETELEWVVLFEGEKEITDEAARMLEEIRGRRDG